MTVSIDGTAGITYPAGTGVQSVGATLMTAQVSTSGTSIDFTGIPAGVKRITVMFDQVSTNGTSVVIVQIGSGSIVSTGYVSSGGAVYGTNLSFVATATGGFVIPGTTASQSRVGHLVMTLIGSNTWVASSVTSDFVAGNNTFSGGRLALSGVLDRVRITTGNGTDAFDAGSINVLYE